MLLTALLFDMDGTLGDTMPAILIALRETFERFAGRTYSDAEIMAMFGPSEEGVIMPRVPEPLREPAVQYYLRRYEEMHDTQPFPGIRDLLRDLRAGGVRIAVVTGKGPRTAGISMRCYGLEQTIDRLETGSPERGDKPASIRRVLEEWGIPPSAAGYVGDMPSDMRDARDVGVVPLGAAWAETAVLTGEDTPYLFRSVAELAAWLKLN